MMMTRLCVSFVLLAVAGLVVSTSVEDSSIPSTLAESEDKPASCGCAMNRRDLTQDQQQLQQQQDETLSHTIRGGDTLDAHVQDAEDNKPVGNDRENTASLEHIEPDNNSHQEQQGQQQEEQQQASRGCGKHMVLISGNTFTMGQDNSPLPQDGEGPARKVTLDSFCIDQFETSNADFAEFVTATGYVTEVKQGSAYICIYVLLFWVCKLYSRMCCPARSLIVFFLPCVVLFQYQ